MCLGVPGKVVAIEPDDRLPMGTVDFGGLRKDVCLAYVPDVGVGEYVIVHVGFAIATVDEPEARRTLAVLRAMGAETLATELGVGVEDWAESERSA